MTNVEPNNVNNNALELSIRGSLGSGIFISIGRIDRILFLILVHEDNIVRLDLNCPILIINVLVRVNLVGYSSPALHDCIISTAIQITISSAI
jgi:hypothetical protein